MCGVGGVGFVVGCGWCRIVMVLRKSSVVVVSSMVMKVWLKVCWVSLMSCDVIFGVRFLVINRVLLRLLWICVGSLVEGSFSDIL